ncbi:helix-turn-helix domain-containing protein [Thalassotalea euphylliae]|uniref:helix-turn-helix domain-containing protein n=1 Tax=Thalassotalea euphylliae TaxID=1655234 RepID=UPI00362A70A0
MLSTFFSHVALAQMLMCILLLFRHCRGNLSVTLFSLLMLCGAGYIVGDLYTYAHNPVFFYTGFIAGNALPGIFWLTAQSVFADKTHIKPWQYALALSTLVLPLFAKLLQVTFNFELSDYIGAALIYFYVQIILELSLISHALFISIKSWRDDLVQERRYIRGGVISVSAAYIFLVIVLEQVFLIEWSGLDVIKSLLLASLITGINYFLFDTKLSVLFAAPEKVEEPQEEVSVHSKALAKITEAMEQEKLYQQEGLTIASFAKHLAIHEYKLRHLINGELNYRNFNDFLNFYRIKEVAIKLTEAEFSQTPVLTLALESGFRSLSSFNKAFKTTHGVTPTEYRKKHSHS